MPREWTEDELELLTEEERAGLDDEEGASDDAGAADADDDSGADASTAADAEDDKGDAAEPGDDPADAAADDAANGDGEADDAGSEDDDAAADGDAAAGQPDADAQPDGDPDGDDKVEPAAGARRPGSDFAPPAGARDRIDAIEAERIALAEKFDEGELTAKEYRQQDSALDKEARDLDWKVKSAEARLEDAKRKWGHETVPAWLEQFPMYSESPRRLQLLDTIVRELQKGDYLEDPLNPDILDKAHALYVEEFGLPPGAEKQSPAKGAAARRAPKREVPPTLANVPASNITEAGDGGKFAHIERLQGEAYEAALAKLSDAEREAYLSS